MLSKEALSLRDYQVDCANKGVDILKDKKIIYYSIQVRCGKTLISLETCKLYGAKRVLFLTKKKAIGSIVSDYNNFGYSDKFELVVINNESLHKTIDNDFDVIIQDEAHRLGGFPKPSKITIDLKTKFKSKPLIFLSGTMSPESFSQLYHQFFVSDYSPWKEYSNFYKWSKQYINVKQKRIGSFMCNDYSEGIEDEIMKDIISYIVTFTQEQSGFQSKITERVLYVKMKSVTHKIADTLLIDRVFEGTKDIILADTAPKLMQKLHQVYSGTVKLESGEAVIIDKSKAEFIKEYFKGLKIAIIYVFKKELDLLSQVFGTENLTNDLDEFNSTDKHFVGQVVSSREGISLYKADALVLYNLQHSNVSYLQVRDRLTLKDRVENNVYLIFAEGGIEDKIYKVVKSKGKYTSNIFKKDYNIKT
jgi:hypothetical protein